MKKIKNILQRDVALMY